VIGPVRGRDQADAETLDRVAELASFEAFWRRVWCRPADLVVPEEPAPGTN